MIELSLTDKVALLIDADNIQMSYLEQLIEFAPYFGEVVICHAFGDWEKPPLEGRKETVEALGIELIQVTQIGKNATDNRMLVEFGAIFGASYNGFGEEVNTFLIASGDGDFASAAEYIKERATVIGIGNRAITSDSLLGACSQFYFLEDLKTELNRLKVRYPIPPDEVRAFEWPLLRAYIDLDKHKTWPWIPYSQLGARLHEEYPDYERRFGKYQLSVWLQHFPMRFACQDQMVRRLDTNPESTRMSLLVRAYLELQQDGRAHLAQMGKKLRELARDYEEQFGGKALSEWIRKYPETFKIDGDYIIHRNHW